MKSNISRFIYSPCLLLGVFLTFGLSAQAKYRSTLYLGDSLSDSPFGERVFELVKSQSDFAAGLAVCASSPFTWNNPSGYTTHCGGWHRTSTGDVSRSPHAPGIVQLIQTYHPDRVVLQTGNNMYEMVGPGNNAAVRSMFLKFKKQILDNGVSSCIWITPLYTTAYSPLKLKALADVMEEAGQPECKVIRSLEITQSKLYPNGGSAQEHPSDKYYHGWFELVRSQIQ